ncbi:alpha/beta fold hydrolase [Kordiimonas aquimaris]|uniref:alpha/beta fold hydrolase n=1 Tax=Kordiimonas aquimaris TaxID=707591 RepID=UPI0021CF3E1F|nr:alpha/beta hydrolase [Kordiimonas aquimaris]
MKILMLERLRFVTQVFAVLALVGASMSLRAEDNWVRSFTESADGTRIAYYVSGEANEGDVPLFILSGGPGSDHRYMRVGGSFDVLAKSRMVVSFDQRGTSQSGTARSSPRLIHWAQDVEAVRAAVGAPKIDILGHSFGGIFGMAYAETYSQHIRSMIFVNSTGPSIAATKSILADVFPDRIGEWQQIRKNLPSRFSASEMRVFTEMEFVNADIGEIYIRSIDNFTYNIEVNNELRKDMAVLDFTETLKAAAFPVLIVHGRYDPVIAPSVSWGLHQIIPGSRLEIIEGTGHLPFAEKPREFVDIIDGFLKNID